MMQHEIDYALKKDITETIKIRIAAFFRAYPDRKIRAAALKEFYGRGGASLNYQDGCGWMEYGPDGIKISKGDERAKLTWNRAAKRIAELIESGDYDD